VTECAQPSPSLSSQCVDEFRVGVTPRSMMPTISVANVDLRRMAFIARDAERVAEADTDVRVVGRGGRCEQSGVACAAPHLVVLGAWRG
jgi:hypothetical protein